MYIRNRNKRRGKLRDDANPSIIRREGCQRYEHRHENGLITQGDPAEHLVSDVLSIYTHNNNTSPVVKNHGRASAEK